MGTTTVPVPDVLRLGGHPVRWRLLNELARSDRQVRELTALVDEPQSLTSYHLRQLRDGGLVTTRRSSADRRDAYYCLDLPACRAALSAAGAALHPGLAPAPPARPVLTTTVRVLFLCTGNSSRSPMAEALLRDLGGDAASAGSAPKPVHPYAVRAMQARGLDIAGRAGRHLDEYVGQRFDRVVSLCDRVREVCPEFPGATDRIHWSIADPAAADDGYRAFTRVADELATRIEFLLSAIAQDG